MFQITGLVRDPAPVSSSYKWEGREKLFSPLSILANFWVLGFWGSIFQLHMYHPRHVLLYPFYR